MNRVNYMGIFVFAAFGAFLLQAVGGVVADKAAASFKYPVTAVKDGRENIEWSTAYSYHVTDGRSSLPRVLLIGDSITAGYQGAVAKKLEGKVNVTYWASSYSVTAPMYWKLAETYLTDIRYDAVHFCPGTHSYHATDEEIETGARRLIALIREKQPQAKLIWCSKTPVTNEVTNAKSLSINRITGRVAEEMGVEWRDDLYLLMKPYDRATYWRDPFHFKPAGIDLEAEQVAQSVLAALGISPSRQQEKMAVRDGIGHVMAKIRAGREVSVAYFGGSITQMDGWRRLTQQELQRRYPKARFREINAAVGGTGSGLGVFRVGKDVIAQKPDLVFVEFASNDSGVDSEEIQRNFDGIVRQIWANDPETDIVFVYTVTAKNLKNYLEGRRQPAALAMEELAGHYGIPSVDWGVEVARRHRSGNLVMSLGEAYTALAPDIRNKDAEVIAMMKREGKTLFAKDGVHPALPGHEIYVSELFALWDAMADLPPADHRVKGAEAYQTPKMERARIVPIEQSMLDDGWEPLKSLTDGNWDQSLDGRHDQAPYFSSRAGKLWKATRSGATLTFRFQGSYCAIYDLLGPGCGIAEVTVDGKRLEDVSRFDGYSSYYRLGSFVAFDGEEGLHEVKIVRSAKSPTKSHVKNRQSGTSREKYRPDDLLFGSIMIVGEVK